MINFRVFGDPPPTASDAPNEQGVWRVPEEVPVAFVYNRRNYAVMLATPADLEDFAVGFSLSERVVDGVGDMTSVDIHQTQQGAELHFTIEPNKIERLDVLQQRRNLVGRAGCGVCGLENADTFFQELPKVSDTPVLIDGTSLKRALNSLGDFQPLNAQTRTVHAAAWASRDGEIQLAREDVGRHNALDKLIGSMARSGSDSADGFLLMSSRCSYEIIEKAARFGITAVASISAPTAFAIRKAAQANITLYSRANDEFVRIKTGNV